MLHKIDINPIRFTGSSSPIAAPPQETIPATQTASQPEQKSHPEPPRLTVISTPEHRAAAAPTPPASAPAPRPALPSALKDFLSIAAHRLGTFLAEAAVLVLVLALLDRFMVKGAMEPRWIVATIAISLALLAGSIATDFSARRWLTRH